jgi:hypothetical protein
MPNIETKSFILRRVRENEFQLEERTDLDGRVGEER